MRAGMWAAAALFVFIFVLIAYGFITATRDCKEQGKSLVQTSTGWECLG